MLWYVLFKNTHQLLQEIYVFGYNGIIANIFLVYYEPDINGTENCYDIV